MEFDKKYFGKWVATKNDKILAADKTLTNLMKKVKKEKDMEQVKFTLIPGTYIVC